MERFSRGFLQVEERLYRFGIDPGKRPIAKIGQIVSADIGFVSMLCRPLLAGHL